ncbi:MAG: hypothetical protein JKY19_14085 [Alcanivoracaceae bacterium]|nr:hypothetical protein [Alcanivoracaceae bacterium]
MLNKQDYKLTVLRSPDKGCLSTVTRWEPKKGIKDSTVYYVKSNPAAQASFIDRELRFLLRYDGQSLPTPKIYLDSGEELVIKHAGDTFEDLANIGVKIEGIDRTIPLLCYTPLLLEVLKGTIQCLQAFHLKGIVHVDFKADNICANVLPLVSSIKKAGSDIKITPSDIKLIDFSYSILDKHPLTKVPPIDAKSDRSSYLAPHLKKILNSTATNDSKIQRLESQLDYGTDLYGLSHWIGMFLGSPSCMESIKITAKKFGIKYTYLFDLMDELECYTGTDDYDNWREAIRTENPDLLPHGKWVKEIDELLETAQKSGYEINHSYTFEYVQVLPQFKSMVSPVNLSMVTPPMAEKDSQIYPRNKKENVVIRSDKKYFSQQKAKRTISKLHFTLVGLVLLLISAFYIKDMFQNKEITEPGDLVIKPAIDNLNTSTQNEPSTPLVDKDKIEALLQQANIDLKAKRLTHPHDDNAYLKYLAVLEQDQQNPYAKKGILDITSSYLGLVEERLQQKNSPKRKNTSLKPNTLGNNTMLQAMIKMNILE